MNEILIPAIECEYANAKLVINNFEKVANTIQLFARKYENLEIIDESEIANAKRDLADLRKKQKMIDDERKKLKKEILSQFEIGNEQYVNLANLLNTAIDNIDTQLKSYEENAKQKKLVEIKDIFEKLNTNKLIIFEKILDDKWLNKTCSISTITTEMTAKLNNIHDNLLILEQIIPSSENELYLAKNEYLKNLDLQKVISDYRERKKLLDAKEVKKIVEKKIYKEDNRVYQIAFAIEASQAKIEQLNLYLKENNIRFKQIKDKELIKNVLEEK